MSKNQTSPVDMREKSCRLCRNRPTCSVPCIHVERLINGHCQRIEPLAPPKRVERLPQSDYNETISELISDRDARLSWTVDEIRSITDGRMRLIASGLLAHLSYRAIARAMGLSKTYVREIAQKTIKQ